MNILVLGPSNFFSNQALSQFEEISTFEGNTAVDSMMMALINENTQNRYTLCSFSSKVSNILRIKEENFDVVVLPERKKARSKIFDLFQMERNLLRTEIDWGNCDNIIAHWPYEYAFAVPKKFSSKLIIVLHDAPISVSMFDISWMRIAKIVMAFLTRFIHTRAKYVAVSQILAQKCKRELLLLRKISLLPNVAVNSLLDVKSQRNSRRILCIGNDSNRKNVEFMILTFIGILVDEGDVQLELIGSGLHIGSNFQNRFLNIPNIVWSGPLPTSDVYRKMGESQVVVSCSREESFGLTCLESLAIGTYFISSNNLDSFREIGFSNPLYYGSTPKNFSQDLSYLVNREYLASEITRSKELINENFGVDSYLKKLFSIL